MTGHMDGSVLNDDLERPRGLPRLSYTGGPVQQLLVPGRNRWMRRRPARMNSDWIELEYWK